VSSLPSELPVHAAFFRFSPSLFSSPVLSEIFSRRWHFSDVKYSMVEIFPFLKVPSRPIRPIFEGTLFLFLYWLGNHVGRKTFITQVGRVKIELPQGRMFPSASSPLPFHERGLSRLEEFPLFVFCRPNPWTLTHALVRQPLLTDSPFYPSWPWLAGNRETLSGLLHSGLVTSLP